MQSRLSLSRFGNGFLRRDAIGKLLAQNYGVGILCVSIGGLALTFSVGQTTLQRSAPALPKDIEDQRSKWQQSSKDTWDVRRSSPNLWKIIQTSG